MNRRQLIALAGGNEPPDEGMMGGLPFDRRCIERVTKFAQG
jgi:hypothetical protein